MFIRYWHYKLLEVILLQIQNKTWNIISKVWHFLLLKMRNHFFYHKTEYNFFILKSRNNPVEQSIYFFSGTPASLMAVRSSINRKTLANVPPRLMSDFLNRQIHLLS